MCTLELEYTFPLLVAADLAVYNSPGSRKSAAYLEISSLQFVRLTERESLTTDKRLQVIMTQLKELCGVALISM